VVAATSAVAAIRCLAMRMLFPSESRFLPDYILEQQIKLASAD